MALQGFVESDYLAAKLAALQADSTTKADWTGKTTAQLKTFLANVGFTPESHYQAYGWAEGLAPNALFNAAEYKLAKATDMFNKGLEEGGTAYATVADAKAALEAAWPYDPYLHYVQYGSAEGINPSNAFDESAYLASKLADLKADAATATEWADKTVDDVKAAFAAAGLSALGHYQAYGEDEGIAVTAVPADEQVDTDDAEAVTGETYTLTTGADNIEGTSDNDTVTGNVDTIGNGGTFNNSDVIDGKGGTDTFNLTISDVTEWPAGAAVKNVEIFNIRNVDAAGNLTFAGIEGAEQIWNNASTGTEHVQATAVQNAVTLGAKNTTSNTSLAYAADKLGSATATQNLNVIGVGTAAAASDIEFDVAGADKITKMTIDSSTTKSNIAIESAVAGTDLDLTDLTVTGDAALTIAPKTTGGTGEFNDLKTIDASDMTAGGLTLDLSAQTANLKTNFKGSAGDDKLTLNAAHLTSDDTLNGGTGDDTLVLDVAGAASSIAADADLVATGAASGVSNFSTVGISATNAVVATGVTVTADLSAFSGAENAVLLSNLGAAAASELHLTNLTIGSEVTLAANQTGIVDAKFKPTDVASGSDLDLTLNLGTSTTAANITAARLDLTQVNNLTIAANGKTAGAQNHTITDLTNAQNTAVETITVTGNQQLSITNDLDVKGLTKIDATGLVLGSTTQNGLTLGSAITNGHDTAQIEILGSNGIDTILGSAKGDTIWGGLGADTITLGTAGATDVVRYTDKTESTTAAKDSITVFEGSRDLLKFEGFNQAGTFTVRTNAQGFSGDGDASAIIANTDLTTGAQDLKIDFDGDSVSDMVVSILGTGTLDAANFAFVA